jgi:UDP-2-acetamido-2-deoxy-ribo-hexuluronate aminotransferase
MNGYKIRHFGLDRQYLNLKNELLEATHLALSSGQLIAGPFTEAFEDWLCMRTGAKYALTVHSGTQALEVIAHYEQFRNPHDFKPIARIPNITYPATLNAFLNAGFDVEIVDTDKNGLLIENEDDHWPKANVYNVHVGLYGAPVNYIVSSLFKNRIIDGAQHWLVHEYIYLDNTPMAISFDPTKNLPNSGNGGAVVSNDQQFCDFVRKYRNNFIDSHYATGTNTKMSEQDCAQILVRTRYINEWQTRRKQIRMYYLDRFKDLPIRCLSRDFEKHADQKFVIWTEWRDELKEFLIDKKIEVRVHYQNPLSDLPITRDFKKPDMLSVSVMLIKGVLSLPIYPELLDSEVEYIADSVCDYFGL